MSPNPDFAQVEADDQLLNATQIFVFLRRDSLRKQPGSLISIGGRTQMFLQQTIGINGLTIDFCIWWCQNDRKLNADTDIGFLSMQTAPLRDDDDNRLRASENFTTLRLRRKFFNQQSFVGLMATNRWVEQKINTGVGLDMLINPSGDHYFVGSYGHHFLKR
ncbi:MAG: hypothetical protein IPP49_20930 [Saprospiraceae bacterium]|nr:hypothetical protein [Saprospiraceae bacterium]